MRGEREELQTSIDALQAKRAMILRFSQSGPDKLSPDAKPLDVGAWPAAWDAVEAAIAKVGADLRPALDKARALDDDIKALEAERQKPPSQAAKRTASVALAAARGGRAALSLSYRVDGVGWVPAYDAALKTSGEANEPDADAPGRDFADDRRGLERRRAHGLDRARRPRRRRRRRAEPANRLLAARDARGRRARRTTGDGEGGAAPGGAAPARRGGRREPPAAVRAAPVAAQEATAQLQANAYSAQFKAPGRVTLASDGAQKSFVLGRLARSRRSR